MSFCTIYTNFYRVYTTFNKIRSQLAPEVCTVQTYYLLKYLLHLINLILSSLLTKRITFDLDILQIDKKNILFLLSHSNCYQDRMSKIFFSFVHCWFFEESNSVEITLNTFLRLLYKYMVQKLLDLTRALFITTKIHTPRWRLQKFKGNFYFRNHIKRAVVFRDGDTFCKGFAGAQVHISHITSSETTSDMTYARVLYSYT